MKRQIPISDDLLFIDLSYFIFYRYYAILNWYSKYSALNDVKHDNDFSNITDDKVFMEKYMKTFESNILALLKKFKIKDSKHVIFFRDCCRQDIWRLKIFNEYKKNRITNKNMDSSIFEKTYSFLDNRYMCLHHPCLEADDIIATCVKNLKCNADLKNFNKTINIITNDSDFIQLGQYSNVNIVNLAGKNLLLNQEPIAYIKCKAIMGDKSDNIPSICSKIGPITSKKLYLDKEKFNKLLEDKDICNQWKINEQLINFDNIPQQYIDEFLSTISFEHIETP